MNFFELSQFCKLFRPCYLFCTIRSKLISLIKSTRPCVIEAFFTSFKSLVCRLGVDSWLTSPKLNDFVELGNLHVYLLYSTCEILQTSYSYLPMVTCGPNYRPPATMCFHFEKKHHPFVAPTLLPTLWDSTLTCTVRTSYLTSLLNLKPNLRWHRITAYCYIDHLIVMRLNTPAGTFLGRFEIWISGHNNI